MMKYNFDVTFPCDGFQCSARVTLSNVPASVYECPVIICPECDRILEVSAGGGYGFNPTRTYKKVEFEVTTLQDEVVSKIPERILQTIKEAIRAFQSGSPYACVAMCRRIVEGIVVTKGAQGRTLKEKIANLGNRQLISERVEIGDGYVRSLGNIACHFNSIPKDEISRTEAQMCLSTAYEVTKEVFLGISIKSRRYDVDGT